MSGKCSEREDGTIIAGNSGAVGKNEEIKKIEEFLLDDTYVDEKSAEDIRNTFETGNPSSFTYQTRHGVGNGYIMKLETMDWFLIQTFPSKVTGSIFWQKTEI